jgi:hypothetical protein
MLTRTSDFQAVADDSDIPISVGAAQVHVQLSVELSRLGYLCSWQHTLKEYLRKYPAP